MACDYELVIASIAKAKDILVRNREYHAAYILDRWIKRMRRNPQALVDEVRRYMLISYLESR